MFQGERRKIKTRINLDALKEAIDNVVQKMQIKVMINANIYVILNYTKTRVLVCASKWPSLRDLSKMKDFPPFPIVLNNKVLCYEIVQPPAWWKKFFDSIENLQIHIKATVEATAGYKSEINTSYSHGGKDLSFECKNITDLYLQKQVLSVTKLLVDNSDVWQYFRFIPMDRYKKQMEKIKLNKDLSNFEDDVCNKPLLYREFEEGSGFTDEIVYDDTISFFKDKDLEYESTQLVQCDNEWSSKHLYKYMMEDIDVTEVELKKLQHMSFVDLNNHFVRRYHKTIYNARASHQVITSLCDNPLDLITREDIAELDVNRLFFIYFSGKFTCLDRTLLDKKALEATGVFRKWIQDPLSPEIMNDNGDGGIPDKKSPKLYKAIGAGGSFFYLEKTSIPKVLRQNFPAFEAIEVDRYRVGNIYGDGYQNGQLPVLPIYKLEPISLNTLKSMKKEKDLKDQKDQKDQKDKKNQKKKNR
jgi:hypothetical protein